LKLSPACLPHLCVGVRGADDVDLVDCAVAVLEVLPAAEGREAACTGNTGV